MLYTIIGTDQKKREKAMAEFASFGSPSAHIYSENISAIEPLIDASSLFGDIVVAHIIQTMEKAEFRDKVYDLLPRMQDSQNIFIVDEPFADANRMKRLEKFSKKIVDAREEKDQKASPFAVVNAFAHRDKKNAWLEWMKIRNVVEPEALQGALWWKFQTVWADTLSGKPTKFTQAECEEIGGRLVRSSIIAHRGEADLDLELESIILAL